MKLLVINSPIMMQLKNNKNKGKRWLEQTSFFLVVLWVFFSCSNKMTSSNDSAGQEVQRTLIMNPGEDNPRNSEGDFIELKDGRVLFVYTHYYGESGGDHGSAYLAGRYSEDDGKTWSREDELILPNEGEMNVMSVSLLRLQNGDIALFYLRKNSTEDCIPMMRISKDEAKTWGDAISCIPDKEGYFVLNNDRVIQLKDGRLLLSVARHAAPGEEWQGGAEIYSYFSDDDGKTWESSTEVPNPDDTILQEPGLVELNDGSIMMFIRSNAGVQCLSYSRDRGESWSQVEKSTLVSPLSPASIERIPETGDLMAVWNNNLSEDPEIAKLRTPLNVAISKDEGKNWENIKTLEDDPDGWYCYTAISFVEDHILLSYCAGNRPEGTGLAVTNVSRLDRNWLYQD